MRRIELFGDGRGGEPPASSTLREPESRSAEIEIACALGAFTTERSETEAVVAGVAPSDWRS